MSFLSALNSLYSNHAEGDNDTITECQSKIPTSNYHYYLMIPSILAMFILALTLPRKNMYLEYLQGRPGAVFPMDVLSKSHRFSYTAAWGSLAFLACDLVLGITDVVHLQGPPYVTVFNKILSMAVIGIDYFPLFASLAVESITGYVIGTLYAWLFLAVQIFKDTECELATVTRTVLVFRDLPNILCLSYLSIIWPVRFVQSIRHKSVPWFSASEKPSNLNLDKDPYTSTEWHHVHGLLRPDPPPPQPPDTKKDKFIALGKNLLKDWVYERKLHFRYSGRVFSVMLMGLMVIYKITLESMVEVLSIFEMLGASYMSAFNGLGWQPVPGEDTNTTNTRDMLMLSYFLLQNIRICLNISMALAGIGSVFTILNMLSSYRSHLFSLYKGDNTHIPHRSTRSNTSLLIGSMRYAPFQVAYIVWGYVLHFVILFLVAVALCVVITLLINGYSQWLVDSLARAWPVLVMTIVIMVGQTLLAKFTFLHEKGELLAINNRRMFFSFTFFMFFYNIFIGFLSCLMRIIKSIVFGAIFLPRLDTSVLPRQVQMFDPGFANYCGFMHVECYHTHPVMLMFLRILMRDTKPTQEEEIEDNDQNPKLLEGAVVQMDELDEKKQDNQPSSAYKKARSRWSLAYTLLNNPSLRVYRKKYMAYMTEVQDRLAKQYHLNTEAASKLVSQMNETMIDNDDNLTDTDLDEKFNPAKRKWNNVARMNKFVKLLQKEMDKNDTEANKEHAEKC